MRNRPHAVAFDVIGTLFSLEPLRGSLRRLGLPSHTLELWLARTLRDGFALAATGKHQPFSEVAAGTLVGLLAEHEVPAEANDISAVLMQFSQLPAHPDAAIALGKLGDSGVRMLALTNGSEDNTGALLKEAHLSRHIERVVSIDQVGIWKPAVRVYQEAAQIAGVQPGQLALVAVHAWDCLGAKNAGLTTAWVSRQEKVFNPALGKPDVQGDSLTGVVEELLALPPG